MYQMKNKVVLVPLRVLRAPVMPNCIAQCHRDPGHCHPKLFTQLSSQVNSHIYHSSSCRCTKVNGGTDRCQIESSGEQSVISTHWQSHPTLLPNFKDRFKDENALRRTALVIIEKQNESDLTSVLSRGQSLSNPYCLPNYLIIKKKCIIQLLAVS